MEQTVEPRSEVEYASSRLHGGAECLLAGPQHRAAGEIALRITTNGFATTAGPYRELAGLGLVNSQGTRIGAVGTFGEVASVLDVILRRPDIGYPDGSKAQVSDRILLDHHEVSVVEECFVLADEARRTLEPSRTPIVWPENFDVIVLLDGHSVGSSPGDEAYPRPCAYVIAAHDARAEA